MPFFSSGSNRTDTTTVVGDIHQNRSGRVDWWAATVVAVLVLASGGCAFPSVTSSSDVSETNASGSTSPTSVDSAPIDSTTSAATNPPTSSSTGTAAPAETTQPAPAASDAVTATTAELPVYQAELVLSDSGLGGRPFGSDPEDVITYVQSLLGSPTEDSGWVEAAQEPQCPGNQIRIVEWGVLSLQFADASPLQAEGQHFFGWTYGSTSEIGESPEGLRTAEGIGPGNSLAEVKAAYPDAGVSEGEIDTAFPDSFFVPDRYWGLLTGATDDDVLTQINSDLGCGD